MTRAIFCTLLAASLFAQTAEKRRPKVGLVLAGGAAHGLAHIGVIRWLDQHRIPVDYVAGTSMGGLVGGLYATGKSGDEILAWVRAINWNKAFQGAPLFPDLSYRRKEDRRDLANSIEIGLKGGVKLPAGLIPGQEIGLLFDQVAAPYAGMGSFDELPIPFRATAVDLVKGETFVFQRGSLATAMRATMSLPGIFTPVRYEGKVLADGGLLNNLPTDVAKEMGAEIIIAVDLSTPAVDEKTLDSLFSVAGRSVSVMIMGSVRRNLRNADLILTPDTEAISASSYEQFAALAERGYAEAARKARFLETLSLSEADYAEHLRARRARIRERRPLPQFITVTGTSAGRAAELRERFTFLLGRPLDRERLETALTRLTGIGRYERAEWAPVARDGVEGLEIRVSEKPYAPPVLNPAFTIDGSDVRNIGFNIGGRVTFYDFQSPGSELRLDFGVGEQNFASGEFFWRPGKSGFFLAPRAQASRRTLPIYFGERRLADYSLREYGGGLDLGYNFGRLNEIRVGYTALYQKASVFVGSPVLPSLKGLSSSFGFRWVYDGANRPVIFTNGIRYRLSADYFLQSGSATSNFGRVETSLQAARPLFLAKGFGLLGMSGGSLLGRDDGALTFFTVGGPLRLGSLGRNERIGNAYYLGSAGYLYELGKLPPLIGSAFYGAVLYQAGNAFLKGSAHGGAQHDGTFGLIGETKIGVIFVGTSVSQRARFYFRVGRFF